MAPDIALKAKDYNRVGYIYSYMGDLYEFQESYFLGNNKYIKAASYFYQANNRRSYAFALRDVGRMYVFTDSNEVALEYMKRAYYLASESNDSIAMSSIANGLGNTYKVLDDLKLAKEYLLQSTNIE